MSGRGAYRKKEQNVKNLHARHHWLVASLSDSTLVSESLVPYLSNQHRFAKLNVSGTPIQPVSLNTLKSIADEILTAESPDGRGFLYLDALRQALKRKMLGRHNGRAGETQRRRRHEQIEEIRRSLQLTEISNLQRSQSYVDLFSKMATLLQSSSIDDVTRLRLQNLLQDHRDLHGALLAHHLPGNTEPSLRVIPGGKT